MEKIFNSEDGLKEYDLKNILEDLKKVILVMNDIEHRETEKRKARSIQKIFGLKEETKRMRWELQKRTETHHLIAFQNKIIQFYKEKNIKSISEATSSIQEAKVISICIKNSWNQITCKHLRELNDHLNQIVNGNTAQQEKLAC